MIEYAASLLPDDYLKDCYIVGVQHILPTTLLMFEELFKKGLKPENLSLIGKCYSSDRKTYAKMQMMGIDICPSSVTFDSHKPFDEDFQDNIHRFLHQRKARLNSPSYKRVIVLDDGGEILDIINGYLERFDHVYGIEQTSSGYNRLLQKEHAFPIVNLARAPSKLSCEPNNIISLSLKRITDFLKTYSKKVQTVLVIGNGSVGSEVYELFKEEFTVFRYDVRPEKSDFPPDQFNHFLAQADMIVGCTGDTSISAEQHQYLKPGCILVSCSSSDREFDAIHLRRRINKAKSCADHLDIDGIILLNCGFPINFNGEDDVDDPEFFQFIRALIIASIEQTSKPASSKGFIALDELRQSQILSKFQHYPFLAGAHLQTMVPSI